jgi:hypothetical protein
MQEPRLTRALVLALSVVAFLVVGCGGSDDSTAASPVTKAQFIKRADRICIKADNVQPRELNAYRGKYKKQLKKLGPVEYEETVVRDLTLPSVKTEIKELKSLKAPDGEEKQVNGIIAGYKAAVRKGERNPYAVARWDRPAKDPFTGINKIVVRYGIIGCTDLR